MDALASIVTLLNPKPDGTKIIHGGGRWGVRYPPFKQPGFALILKGKCFLTVEGTSSILLEAGDFVLFPSTPGFAMASDAGVETRWAEPTGTEQLIEEVFHGDPAVEPSVSMLGGYFAFDRINASVLLSFLPRMLHIKAANPAIDHVAPVVELIRREARDKRAGRAFVLTRLIEVLLIEALRSAPVDLNPTGLLAGLRDRHIAAALQGIHTKTNHPWTLVTLAREAAMSRSSFAERFARVVGMTPLNYLLQWRLAVARHMLIHEAKSVAETALAVGYESASGFSTAFNRETGLSPRDFVRAHCRPPEGAGGAV